MVIIFPHRGRANEFPFNDHFLTVTPIFPSSERRPDPFLDPQRFSNEVLSLISLSLRDGRPISPFSPTRTSEDCRNVSSYGETLGPIFSAKRVACLPPPSGVQLVLLSMYFLFLGLRREPCLKFAVRSCARRPYPSFPSSCVVSLVSADFAASFFDSPGLFRRQTQSRRFPQPLDAAPERALSLRGESDGRSSFSFLTPTSRLVLRSWDISIKIAGPSLPVSLLLPPRPLVRELIAGLPNAVSAHCLLLTRSRMAGSLPLCHERFFVAAAGDEADTFLHLLPFL